MPDSGDGVLFFAQNIQVPLPLFLHKSAHFFNVCLIRELLYKITFTLECVTERLNSGMKQLLIKNTIYKLVCKTDMYYAP